ncbi:MAG: hypothetical protein Q7V62_06915, partial [Actinomycetota bacterium]|nr:hypothetical protein [Actinomycetota bacterium]
VIEQIDGVCLLSVTGFQANAKAFVELAEPCEPCLWNVDWRGFDGAVRCSFGDVVTLEDGPAGTVTIGIGCGEIVCDGELLKGKPGAEPEIKQGPAADAKPLRRLLRMAAPFCSTDNSRPNLNGVQLRSVPGRTEATAADGHRLTTSSAAVGGEPLSVIIPRGSMRLVDGFLRGRKTVGIEAIVREPSPTKVGGPGPRLRFTDLDSELVVKCIDETCPEWQKVMPKAEPRVCCVVNVEAALHAVYAVRFVVDRHIKPAMSITLVDGVLVFSSKTMFSTGSGVTATGRCSVRDWTTFGEWRATVNASYVQDALVALRAAGHKEALFESQGDMGERGEKAECGAMKLLSPDRSAMAMVMPMRA